MSKKHLNSFDLFYLAYDWLVSSMLVHVSAFGNGLAFLFALQIRKHGLTSSNAFSCVLDDATTIRVLLNVNGKCDLVLKPGLQQLIMKS